MSMSLNKTRKDKKPVEVVVFEDPDKPRKWGKTSSDEKSQTDKNKSKKSDLHFERPVFDQRMAKFDIHKLAMTGMKEVDKEEAMVNYLVELGAKRPKGKPVPMKEYVQELKKRKCGANSNDGSDDWNKKKQKRGKREKRDIFLDGQVGKWKRGVQFVNGKKLSK